MSLDFAAVSKNAEEALQKTYAIVSIDDSEEITKCYDDWAETYDEDMVLQQYSTPQKCSEIVAELFGDRKEVLILDAGAGTGKTGAMLNKMGYKNIDALDASKGMLEVAKKKNVYKNFIISYLGPNRLDIEDGRYDLVLIIGALGENHVKEDCLPEMKRITKPGGFVVLSVEDGFEDMEVVNHPGFERCLEDKLRSMEEEGQWRLLDRKHVDNTFFDKGAIFYVLQVL